MQLHSGVGASHISYIVLIYILWVKYMELNISQALTKLHGNNVFTRSWFSPRVANSPIRRCNPSGFVCISPPFPTFLHQRDGVELRVWNIIWELKPDCFSEVTGLLLFRAHSSRTSTRFALWIALGATEQRTFTFWNIHPSIRVWWMDGTICKHSIRDDNLTSWSARPWKPGPHGTPDSSELNTALSASFLRIDKLIIKMRFQKIHLIFFI